MRKTCEVYIFIQAIQVNKFIPVVDKAQKIILSLKY